MVTGMTDISDRVDPELVAVLTAIRPSPFDPADLRSVVESLRVGAAKARARMPAPALPSSVALQDHSVPGPDGHPDVMVRTYRPTGLRDGASALYWIHGGGMVMGDVAGSDLYCASLAEELGILVASVEYRVAPECPFPAPIEDCYAGLRWLASAASELGIDAERIAIAGGSAGAGLAAGLALLARDRGEIAVCHQFLFFPMLDDRSSTGSVNSILDLRVWNLTFNRAGWDAYLSGGAGAEGVSPYAAPARATDLAGLPPAYICVGTLDPLLDEDVAYAQALMSAGVPVELHVYPGAFHASSVFAPAAALSKRWVADERAAMHRVLNSEH